VRRGLRGAGEGRREPRRDRPGAHRPREPRAPRGLGLRSPDRRWRGHPRSDPRCADPRRLQEARHRPRGPRHLGPGDAVPAFGPRPPGRAPRAPQGDHRARVPGLFGGARGPDRSQRRGPLRAGQRAVRGAGAHRSGDAPRRRSRARAQALRDQEALRVRGAGPGTRRRGSPLPRVDVDAHRGLQGPAHPGAAAALLPRSRRSARALRAGGGPPALQHQHLPQLVTRPPVPPHRAQRRDQHPAREHQLDAGPRARVGFAHLR
jgi:hypothetical protein